MAAQADGGSPGSQAEMWVTSGAQLGDLLLAKYPPFAPSTYPTELLTLQPKVPQRRAALLAETFIISLATLLPCSLMDGKV